MKRERESNYDLLRILCTIVVVIIHVSSIYINAITDDSIFGALYLDNMAINISAHAMTRFNVPCFVMLSGAFVLSDKKTGEYRDFYRKFIKRMVIPTLLFSLFYCIYSYGLQFYSYLNGGQITDILAPVKDWIRGIPFYHMWYMYMIMGVYLLAPIVYKFKEDIGDKYFERVAWVFMIVASVCEWTGNRLFLWDIGSAFCYLGYFMVGYVLRKKFLEKKENKKSILLILTGVFVFVYLTWQRYQYALQGLADAEIGKLLEYHNPWIVIGSILLFAGFSCMRFKGDLSRQSAYTFEIYLIHPAVWGILYRVITAIFGAPIDSKWMISLGTIAVFLISLVLSIGYQKLWKAFETKTQFTDRLCKCLKI